MAARGSAFWLKAVKQLETFFSSLSLPFAVAAEEEPFCFVLVHLFLSRYAGDIVRIVHLGMWHKRAPPKLRAPI